MTDYNKESKKLRDKREKLHEEIEKIDEQIRLLDEKEIAQKRANRLSQVLKVYYDEFEGNGLSKGMTDEIMQMLLKEGVIR